MPEQHWEVVGGADKGGILVREGAELTSAQVEQRLSTGAVVQELTLKGDRLQFQLVKGSGPPTGWVSTAIKEKVLLVKCNAEPAKGSGSSKTIFDFEVPLADGTSKKLEAWKTPVTLIVNTASKCGFTGQYEGLQTLYNRFNGAGLEILAFPCNQFLKQEPEDNRAIQDFVKSKYGVTFPVFAKVDTNGAKSLALFSYLKDSVDGAVPRPPWAKTLHPEEKDIQWNFTKFLCVQGVPVKRFSFDVDPAAMAADIEAALAQAGSAATGSASRSTPSGKRRVVCLHGTACSEKIFRTQLGKMLPMLKEFELVFLEGRSEVTEGPAFELMQKYFPNARNCQYDRVSLDAKGWRIYDEPATTLAWLQDELKRIGPVNGILGFSQGANFATMLAAQASLGQGMPLDFVVLLCPNAPGYVSQLRELFQAPISPRAFIAYGKQEGYGAGMDAAFDKAVADGMVTLEKKGEESPALHVAKLYSSHEVFVHDEGHRPLPADKQQAEKLAQAVKEFMSR